METRTPSRQLVAAVDRHRVGHGEDDAHRIGRGLAVFELGDGRDVGGRLGHPVATGDAEVEQPLLDVLRDLLRAQEAHPVDTRVVDARVVITLRSALDGEIGRSEQIERGFFQRTLGQDERKHDSQCACDRQVARADAVAEQDRGFQSRQGGLAALVLRSTGSPERSSACCSVSQVRTPKPTGVDGIQ